MSRRGLNYRQKSAGCISLAGIVFQPITPAIKGATLSIKRQKNRLSARGTAFAYSAQTNTQLGGDCQGIIRIDIELFIHK